MLLVSSFAIVDEVLVIAKVISTKRPYTHIGNLQYLFEIFIHLYYLLLFFSFCLNQVLSVATQLFFSRFVSKYFRSEDQSLLSLVRYFVSKGNVTPPLDVCIVLFLEVCGKSTGNPILLSRLPPSSAQ